MTVPPTVSQRLSERRRQELREAVERLNKVVDRLEVLIRDEEEDTKGGRDDA
jgi:hypothetical protein